MTTTFRYPVNSHIGAASSWRQQGSCLGDDADAFFAPDGREPALRRAERERRAKQICRQCPVLAECAENAIVAEEQYGIWGGMSETERAPLIREYRRGSRSLRHIAHA
jgi:WhiB family transcriptional regulator, redox-sensing transcriptional regulator